MTDFIKVLADTATEVTTEAGSSATTEAKNEIINIINIARNTDKISMVIKDVIVILVVIAIFFLVITILLHVRKAYIHSKDPNYEHNDDDFLDE